MQLASQLFISFSILYSRTINYLTLCSLYIFSLAVCYLTLSLLSLNFSLLFSFIRISLFCVFLTILLTLSIIPPTNTHTLYLLSPLLRQIGDKRLISNKIYAKISTPFSYPCPLSPHPIFIIPDIYLTSIYPCPSCQAYHTKYMLLLLIFSSLQFLPSPPPPYLQDLVSKLHLSLSSFW